MPTDVEQEGYEEGEQALPPMPAREDGQARPPMDAEHQLLYRLRVRRKRKQTEVLLLLILLPFL